MFNVYTLLFLALQKVQMVKITPQQILAIKWKNLPTKFFHTLRLGVEIPHRSLSCYLEHPDMFRLAIMRCRSNLNLLIFLTVNCESF